MSETPEVHTIRELVRQTFCELGSVSNLAPRETLLIRHGRYCGHHFQHDALRAVWFAEENEVKFYGTDGRLIKVLRPLVLHADQPRAA
jgi:hypothetical protein